MRALLSLPALGLLIPTLWQPDASTPPVRTERSAPVVASIDDELAVVRRGCLACHDAPEDVAQRLEPVPAPGFGALGKSVDREAMARRIADHYGAGQNSAALAAFLAAENGRELEGEDVSPAVVDQGSSLFDELACAACHTSDSLAGRVGDSDYLGVTGFLTDPAQTRPDIDHDFGIQDGEARALAAFLLRDTFVRGAEGNGYQVECFEMRIRGGGEPDLSSAQSSSSGLVRKVDIEPRTRGQNYALRFRTTLKVENTGTYRFEVGSDDGSWLYIDGNKVVDNSGLKPFKKVKGEIELTAGRHDLLLVFTQSGGGAQLTLQWAPPNGKFADIPYKSTSTQTDRLTPKSAASAPSDDLVASGRNAYIAGQCARCHEGPALDGAPKAPALLALDASRNCPTGSMNDATRRVLRDAPRSARTDAETLAFELERGNCRVCHVRDGKGGLPAPIARALTETQDLGEEGRRPPSLDRAGNRFQTSWIRKVLAERADARPYMLARCVSVDDERATRIANAFDAVDSESGDNDEPEFSQAALDLGRAQMGTKGKACITCHMVQGRASLGPQGLDLSQQSERLKPAWFRDWLRRPHEIRPGTRMPAFWIAADEAQASREIDAIRVWTNFGSAAPLPEGFSTDSAGTVLQVGERPRLHGAFLKDLSARCLAVGTPERVHYAYDLANGRLRWLWRGDFVDGRGTWNGRAGQLVTPLGGDWVVLPELNGPIAGDEQQAKVVARRFDEDGYPIFVIAIGDVRVEDHLRPRFEATGPVMVRKLTAVEGSVRLDLSDGNDFEVRTTGGMAVTPRRLLKNGETLEVIYRW